MMRAIRSFLFRNGWLKLLAFALAFILWITLMPEEKIVSEKTFQVRLDSAGLPADLEMTERPPATIDVTVRATNRLLGQMTSSDVRAVLNLSRATPAQEDYPLNPDIITVPAGAKAVRVFPNKAHLKVEQSAEVLMEIQPVVVGHPDPEFKVDNIEILPSKVFVRGPASKIRPQDRIRTSPIDITGLREPNVYEVDLILPRPELRFMTSQTRAAVTITLISK